MRGSIKTFIITLLISFVSCSKYEVSEDLGINTSELLPNNITTSLPVININVDNNDFITMMNNYEDDVKILGSLSMFNASDTILFSDSIKLNIKGNGSAIFDLKSLSVKFHHSINNEKHKVIEVDKHLPTHFLKKLKKISLRNSGNDCEETFIKDICYTDLAISQALDIELSYYRPVQVFVNNSFYGLLNLRTEKNDDALSKLLEVDKHELNIIKINSINGYEDVELKDGDDDIMLAFSEDVYSNNLENLKLKVDINSFVDYVVFQDIIGNSDWPSNNVELYSVGTGKFRFFLFDMDLVSIDDKFFVLEDSNVGFIYEMYKTLIQDNDISSLIKKRQKEIFNYCTNERFHAIVDKNANVIEHEIDYNISKYGLENGHVRWYLDIEKMLDQYKIRRENYKKHYNL